MREDRIKDISELPDLSMMKCERHGLPQNWGFSKGRNGFDSNQWCITFTHDDLSQDVYPLPMFVSVLVAWNRNWEREEIQRKFINLLGLQ